VSVPASIADFANLVTGLDLSTDAGQAMFEALMQIAPAFYDVATAADQLAKKQADLQVQLLQAQGLTEEATALQRQLALAAMDPSLQALQQEVWAAQDAAAAAATALALSNKQQEMQVQLLQAQGKATEALALQRQMELAALDPSLRGLQQQIYAAQDLATAKDNLTAAYKREADALQSTIDKFRGFAATLREFRDSLFTSGDSSLSYNAALVKLMKEAGLARGGDEAALGGGLQDSAQQFLDIATANAASLQDVQRARALVVRYLDQAIGGAEGKASIAEQQLKQLHDQVDKLVDIDEHVQSVTDAIKALTELMFPGSTHVTTPPKTVTAAQINGFLTRASPERIAQLESKVTAEQLEEIKKHLAEINAATTQTAVASNKSARVLSGADRGGAIALVTDSDSPISTVAA
jgi:hypothetical protein